MIDALWGQAWFRVVSYISGAIMVAVLVTDAIFMLAGKPTYSKTIVVHAKSNAALPLFFGALGGHWFVWSHDNAWLKDHGLWILAGLLVAVAVIDGFAVRYTYSRLQLALWYLSGIPIGSLLWGLSAK